MAGQDEQGDKPQAALNRKAKDLVDSAADAESGGPPEEQKPRNSPRDGHPDGPANTPKPDQPPSGALDAEGHRPVLERSRKVR